MNPRLVTLFNDDYEVGFVCAAVNALYGKQHDLPVYPLVLSRAEMDVLCEGRHYAWAKVALLRWIFAAEGDAELTSSGAAKVLGAHLDGAARSDLAAAGWIIWVDADLMVVDHARDLRTFLRGSKDLVLGEDMADLDWLNTGLVACRTDSPWVRGIWAKFWCEGDPAFHQDEFWDQSAICGCLARWGERGFRPTVVGGKPTGLPAPERPWFSWQGGLRVKETEHLLVLNAGGWQINNPRYAQFAFHAAGMKDKAQEPPCSDCLARGWAASECGQRQTTMTWATCSQAASL